MSAATNAHAVLSVAEMYAADKAAEAAGIASLNLMEAAGLAVARQVQARFIPQPVTILCGPGNNGGDGFVVARLLAESGWPVRLGLLGAVAELKGDAAVNAKRWRGTVNALSIDLLDGKPLVIDALFGAGLSRAIDGTARTVIERITADTLTCIAIDVPSGVQGDSSLVLGAAPRCALTVTFFRLKPVHLLFPGRDLCGEVTVADIGIPESVLLSPQTVRNRPGIWALPAFKWNDHKYARCHAVVVGSAGISGAARLAGRAARRAGAGVLTYAVPEKVFDIYAGDAPGAFVRAVDTPEDLDAVLADKRRNGVLIGPGAAPGPDTAVRLLKILAANRAVVLDAGALASFEDDPGQLFAAIRRNTAPVVMTPHDGEFACLFKGDAFAQGGKLGRARAAAKASGAVVIFKGPDSVVAAPDGRAAIADNAPPWLATAGSGDVLAGIILGLLVLLGLLVQSMTGWEAAAAGVWLHGAAASRFGRGLTAEDLPEELPKLLKSL